MPVIVIDTSKSSNIFYATTSTTQKKGGADVKTFRLYNGTSNDDFKTSSNIAPVINTNGTCSLAIPYTYTSGDSTSSSSFQKLLIHKANDSDSALNVIEEKDLSSAISSSGTLNVSFDISGYSSYQVYVFAENKTSFDRKGIAEVKVMKINGAALSFADLNSKINTFSVTIPKIFDYKTDSGTQNYNITGGANIKTLTVRLGYFLNVNYFKSFLSYTSAGVGSVNFINNVTGWYFSNGAIDKDTNLSGYTSNARGGSYHSNIYLYPQLKFEFKVSYAFPRRTDTTTTTEYSVVNNKVNTEFKPTKVLIKKTEQEIETLAGATGFPADSKLDKAAYGSTNFYVDKIAVANNGLLVYGKTAALTVPYTKKQYKVKYISASYNSETKGLDYNVSGSEDTLDYGKELYDDNISTFISSNFEFVGWTATAPASPLTNVTVLSKTAKVEGISGIKEIEEQGGNTATPLYPVYKRTTKNITFTDTDEVEFNNIKVSTWNGTSYGDPSVATLTNNTISVTTLIDKITYDAVVSSDYYVATNDNPSSQDDASVDYKKSTKYGLRTSYWNMTFTGVTEEGNSTIIGCSIAGVPYNSSAIDISCSKLELKKVETAIKLDDSDSKIALKFGSADAADITTSSKATDGYKFSDYVRNTFTITVIANNGYEQNVGKIVVKQNGSKITDFTIDGNKAIFEFTIKEASTITIDTNAILPNKYSLTTNIGDYCKEIINNNTAGEQVFDYRWSESYYIYTFNLILAEQYNQFSFNHLIEESDSEEYTNAGMYITVTDGQGNNYPYFDGTSTDQTLSYLNANPATKAFIYTSDGYKVYGICGDITVAVRDLTLNKYEVEARDMQHICGGKGNDYFSSIAYSILNGADDTLISEGSIQASGTDGISSIADINHGNTLQIKVTLNEAYSKSKLTSDNMLINGKGRRDISCDYFANGDFYLFTIANIRSALVDNDTNTILLDLTFSPSKNTYAVTFRNDEINKYVFNVINKEVEHAGSIAVGYETVEGYDQRPLAYEHIMITFGGFDYTKTATASTRAWADAHITVTVDTASKTITISGITEDVTVSLIGQDNIEPNTYELALTADNANSNKYKIVELDDSYNVIATYKQASEFVANKVYFTRTGTDPDYTYTVVENPVAENIATYYEVDATATTSTISHTTYNTDGSIATGKNRYLLGINYEITAGNEETLEDVLGEQLKKFYAYYGNDNVVCTPVYEIDSLAHSSDINYYCVWNVTGKQSKAYYREYFESTWDNFYAFIIEVENVDRGDTLGFVISDNDYFFATRVDSIYTDDEIKLSSIAQGEVTVRVGESGNFVEAGTVITPGSNNVYVRFTLNAKYEKLGTNTNNFAVYSYYTMGDEVGAEIINSIVSVTESGRQYTIKLAPINKGIVLKLKNLSEKIFRISFPTSDGSYSKANAEPTATEDLDNPLASVKVIDNTLGSSLSSTEYDAGSANEGKSYVTIVYGHEYTVDFAIKHYYTQYFDYIKNTSLNGSVPFSIGSSPITSAELKNPGSSGDGLLHILITVSSNITLESLALEYNPAASINVMVINRHLIYNDGTDASTLDQKTKNYGDEFGELPAFDSNKYAFNGWYDNADLTGDPVWVTGDDPLSIYEDTELYAKLTINTFTVTMQDRNGLELATIPDIKYGSSLDMVCEADGSYTLVVTDLAGNKSYTGVVGIPVVIGSEGYDESGDVVNPPVWELVSGSQNTFENGVSENYIFKPQYTINKYKLTFVQDVPKVGAGQLPIDFNADDAETSVVENALTSIEYNKEITVTNPVMRGLEGGVFNGWRLWNADTVGGLYNVYEVGDEDVLGYKVGDRVVALKIEAKTIDGVVNYGYYDQNNIFVAIDLVKGLRFVAEYVEYEHTFNANFTISDGELSGKVASVVIKVPYTKSFMDVINELVANNAKLNYLDNGETKQLSIAEYSIDETTIRTESGTWSLYNTSRLLSLVDKTCPVINATLKTRGKIFTFVDEGGNTIAVKTVSLRSPINSLVLPAIPTKTGYDQIAPRWDYEFTETLVTADNNAAVIVKPVYTINKYTVTIKMPDGTDVVKEVNYGDNVEVPQVKLKFGQYISYNKKTTQGIDSNETIEVVIKSYLIWIILGAVAVFLGLATVAVIAIVKAVSRDKASVKQSGSIIEKLREQDMRMAQKGLTPGKKPGVPPQAGAKPIPPQGVRPPQGPRPSMGVPPTRPAPKAPPKPEDPNKPKA